MSHHFQDLLEDLRGQLARMAALVRQALEHALGAVESRNVELAETVISGDRRIDQEEVNVERGAIDLLALYQPAASDLRLIATIIKVNSDLERIADCAVNIAQRVIMLEGNFSFREPPELSQLADFVSSALRNTIQAFNLQDERLARQVLRSDDRIDALYAQIVADMLTAMQSADSQDLNASLANIMIAKNLERIADHCSNVAENVIYVNSGEI